MITAERSLSDLMDFDHVVGVDSVGRLYEPDSVYAPELDGETLLDDSWSLLSGFTGQYSYNGPVMHPSEYIGGGLERHIRTNPGLYVALVVEDIDEDEFGEREVYGWAVAYRPAT